MELTHSRNRVSRQRTSGAGAVARLRPEVYAAAAEAAGVRKGTHLARLHGVHRSTLSRIRAGEAQATLSTALRMAADLQVPVEQLFELVEAA